MDGLNALIFFVLIVGHTELQVTAINRLHSLRLRCGTLRHLRHFHDVLIPVFPVLLIWFVGLNGAGLLAGGHWSDVGLVWRMVLTVCAFGFFGFCKATLQWRFTKPPAVQVGFSSQTFDIAERLGNKPTGGGRAHWMTAIPGNECFQLEVVARTLRLPNWPAAWDGLSILHLSDLHFHGTPSREYFEAVCEIAMSLQPDLITFTGDLLDKQHLVEWLPDTLGKLRARLGCYFILGNHDWYLQPDETRRALTDLGWIDVAAGVVAVYNASPLPGERVAEVRVRGTPSPNAKPCLLIGGDERPWMGTAANFSTVKPQSDDIRLLLSHTPDNLPWAKRNGVDVMLSGHNHGGQVVLPVIGPVYSPSRFGVKYSAGLFWESPTLLHVSRGISGKLPLRWNCLPEITKLVFRSDVDISPQKIAEVAKKK